MCPEEMETHSKEYSEMISEMQFESAQQLMTSILYETSAPGCTGFTALDSHSFSSLRYHPSPTSSLNRGDVIEIQGPASSGKTHFLYQLAMNCILPQEIQIFTAGAISPKSRLVHVGGWAKSAIIMDTDNRWSITRLHHLLSQRLERLLPMNSTALSPSVDELISASLRNLHIFRPTTSISLAATLMKLPAYHASKMPTSEVMLLAIDSLSAFYWQDRFNNDTRRAAKDTSLSPLHHILINLQNFRLSHGPVTVLTNWGLSPATKSNSDNAYLSTLASTSSDLSNSHARFYRQHLHPFPAPFQNPPQQLANANLYPPITHHLTFPPMCIGSLAQDPENIQNAVSGGVELAQVVEKGQLGIVRTVGSGEIGEFVFEVRPDEIRS